MTRLVEVRQLLLAILLTASRYDQIPHTCLLLVWAVQIGVQSLNGLARVTNFGKPRLDRS